MAYTYKYPRPAVTADCIVIAKESEPKVLLIERGDEPFKKTLRDWYLSHLENNDDGSGLISTIAIRDAALNGLGVHLLISFMTRKLGFLLWQATLSMTE